VGLLLNLPLLLLVAERVGGLPAIADSIARGYERWKTIPIASPATSPWLIDATSFVSRFLGYSPGSLAQIVVALVVVGVAGLALRRVEWNDSDERNVGVGIMGTAVLASGHHLGYDMVLLTAPAIALAAGRLPVAVPRSLRWSLGVLYAVPALNWAATHGVLNALQPSFALWLFLTSINAFCLLLLFLGHLGIAFAYCGPAPGKAISSAEPRWA
jgi:hypothetical protein